MTSILSDDFETPLGTIRAWAETDDKGYIQQEGQIGITTSAHHIYLQTFDLKQVWAPDGAEYEGGRGWRWFIRKINDQHEDLTIFCKLTDPAGDVQWVTNSGEHLDAIEIENKTHHLHIGTEDGEMMQYRAETSDRMPERLHDEVSLARSFTEYVDFGFKTRVPGPKRRRTDLFPLYSSDQPD